MTAPYDGVPRLTAEQRAVVDQPADAKVSVTASAGTGKTHTLVRRLDALVARHDLAAGEILVLTFSRAAVRELSRRLAGQGEAARYVAASTFDSWALRLLTHADASSEWSIRPFDDRIRAAADLIATGGVDDLYADDLLHVVIDEVQDLVGPRRELVEALLDRYDCGFTVVGDPAQAIYGFQVDDQVERASEAGRFAQWLRVTFGDELVELELTTDFRTRTDGARIASAPGSEVRRLTSTSAPASAFTQIRKSLWTDLLDALSIGDLSDGFVQDSLREYEGTCAILCRTNGQALVVSEQLHRGKVAHRFQTAAGDRTVPGWLALLFPADAASLLGRDEFEALVGGSDGPAEAERAEAWRQLLRFAGSGNGRVVDRGRLSAAIRGARLPDELTAPAPARLVVSSIHRAKGLEFDRVVVVEPDTGRQDGPVDLPEETRLLYVAMSRARDDVLRVAAPDTALVRKCAEIDRWGRYGWRKWQRAGLELRGGDVEPYLPPGIKAAETTAEDLQRRLRETISPGDGVRLERDEGQSTGDGEAPVYRVVHGNSVVGVTSGRFRNALRSYMRVSRHEVTRSWPRVVSGGRVESLETVAGGTAAGHDTGLGGFGIRLTPRLGGLTRFVYDSTELQGGRHD